MACSVALFIATRGWLRDSRGSSRVAINGIAWCAPLPRIEDVVEGGEVAVGHGDDPIRFERRGVTQ